MPTSKKQLTKLNQVKKVKAEELSKAAAAGSKDAKKKSRNSRKNSSEQPGIFSLFFYSFKVSNKRIKLCTSR